MNHDIMRTKRRQRRRWLTTAGIGITFLALSLWTMQAYGKAPKGWFVTGSAPTSYQAGLDPKIKRSGKSSGTLRAKPNWTKGFGTLTQVISARAYRGKRVRLKGWLKTKDVTKWAAMWMRVDGKKRKVLSFDNMQRRPLRGTIDWKQYHIVLDVPQSATRVVFGVLLSGKGQMWLDDFTLEIVSHQVPVTARSIFQLPTAPANLGFEQ